MYIRFLRCERYKAITQYSRQHESFIYNASKNQTQLLVLVSTDGTIVPVYPGEYG